MEPLEVGSSVTVGKGFGTEVGFDIGKEVDIIVGTADVGLLKSVGVLVATQLGMKVCSFDSEGGSVDMNVIVIVGSRLRLIV